jgi:hypothetical protein
MEQYDDSLETEEAPSPSIKEIEKRLRNSAARKRKSGVISRT